MKMGLTIIAIATAAAVTWSPEAIADGVPADKTFLKSIASANLKKNEPFLKARARLIKLGWDPVRMHANGSYEYDGAEKRLIEHNFYEVDSCSIDAGAICILYYKKSSMCLRVDTVGEQVKVMKVARWVEECPSSN
jgi:hypothetical protein